MQPSVRPPVPDLPLRQVHLDFHTSPLIPGIAKDFDPDAFARTLRDAHISSITYFAVCHHGLSYYPTKIGTMHPHLTRDLLGEQIEACYRHGLRAPHPPRALRHLRNNSITGTATSGRWIGSSSVRVSRPTLPMVVFCACCRGSIVTSVISEASSRSCA